MAAWGPQPPRRSREEECHDQISDVRHCCWAFADALRARGSACGESHIQRTAFFLQQLTLVPLGLAFRLWKHGPYSFDLKDEISELLG